MPPVTSNTIYKPRTGKALALNFLLLLALTSTLYYLSSKSVVKPVDFQKPGNATDTYVFDSNYHQHASRYYTFLVDTFNNIGIRQADSLNALGKFRAWHKPGTPFNLGMNSKVTWFHVPVKNESPYDVFLVWFLGNTLDTAQLFWKKDDTIHAHQTVSFFTPLHERALPLRAMFDTLWLRSGEHRELYLRLWKNHYNTYVPMVLLPWHELQEQEAFLSNVYCVYIAVFFFIILFNIFLYALLRDSIHLWYSFYIFSISMVLLLDAFYDVFLFPDFLHRIFSITETMPFADFVALGTGIVMQLLLGHTKDSSRFYVPLRVFFVLDFVWGVLQLSVCIVCLKAGTTYPYYELHTVSDILVFSTIFLTVASVIERMLQRQLLAYLYFFSVMLPIMGILNYYLNSIGFTNFRFLYPNSISVGVMLEVIALTLLLSQRYNLLQREKNQLLQQQLALQKEMSERIAETQESEQRRIAADLHDGIGGYLAALRLMVNKSIHNFSAKGQQEPAEILQTVQQQIDTAAADIRAISHNLMPKDFEQNEFTHLIKSHLETITPHADFSIEYYLDPQISSVPKSIQITLYRIFTEIMNNALKHSGGKHVSVQFLMHDSSLQMMVEDDGTGFKTFTDSISQRDGIGLKNIQSRVQFLKGTVKLDSGEKGTTLIIEIPLS